MSYAALVMIAFRIKYAFMIEYVLWKCVGILKENVSEDVLTLMSKEVISVNFCVCWILVKLKIICTIIYCGVFFNIYLLLVLFHGQLLSSEKCEDCLFEILNMLSRRKNLLIVTFLDQGTILRYNDEELTTVCEIVLWENVLKVLNKN